VPRARANFPESEETVRAPQPPFRRSGGVDTRRVGLYTILPSPILCGMHCNKGWSGDNTVLLNRVGDAGGGDGAPKQGGCLRIMVLILGQRPRTKRISCKGQAPSDTTMMVSIPPRDTSPHHRTAQAQPSRVNPRIVRCSIVSSISLSRVKPRVKGALQLLSDRSK